LLLRSRHLVGVWQRSAVSLAGTAGVVFIVLGAADTMPVWMREATVVLVLLAIAPLVFAATREPTRRLLPIWGHLANVFETLAALLVVPLTLHVLGLYAWARGLTG
jgi:hypothetical protein